MAFNPNNPNGQATMAASAPVVIASNQSAVPVSGTFFQATQPVSASALPLPTGASTETTLAAINTKTAALGSAVSASSSPVVIASDQGNVPTVLNDATASGTITTQNLVPAGAATAGSAVEIILNGRGSAGVQITGTYTGALTSQGTIDGTTWVTIGGSPLLNINTGALSATIVSATQGIFLLECAGFARVRVTALAAVTGNATVSLRATASSALVALDAALPAGANTIGGVTIASGTVTTVSTVTTLSTLTGGNAAEDAATSANPLIVGGIVRTTTSPVTLVAGDACRETMTSGGAVVQKPYAVPEADWSFAGATGGIINTTDVVLKAAAGASLRNYLTSITIQNASATTATEVVVKDGATVIFRGYVGAQTLLNSVIGITFPSPLKSTANTALNVACITTAAAVYVNAQGYVAQ